MKPVKAKRKPTSGYLTREFLVPLCAFLVMATSLSGCGKKDASEKWSPHYRKAVESYRRGDFQAAVSLFQKALLYTPSNAEIYLDIAAIYDDFLGNTTSAISYYERYLKAAAGEDGAKVKWVKRLLSQARARLAAAGGQKQPLEPPTESVEDEEEVIENLRGELKIAKQSLAEEKEKTAALSERASGLQATLAAALKEKKELETRLAGVAGGRPEDAKAHVGEGEREDSIALQRLARLGWVLSLALGILVVALVVRQRHVSARERALMAGIGAAASGSTEDIRKEDVLGKYFWVENDRNAGILSVTEKDDEIHVCAIDGRTRLRSRGRGKLVGNVLTAELRSGGEESVVTKFIFANKGRTVTAVWQGDEGTAVAAGTKEVSA